MKSLKRLGVSVTLSCVLTMVAFADGTSSPPCDPGETHGPPCSSSMATGGAAGGHMDTDVASSITEAALVVLESVLPLI